MSSREGHVLVYGVTDPFAVPHGIGMASLCREVHRQGGARSPLIRSVGVEFDDARRERPELDGLELMTSNMDADCRRRAAAIRDEYRLAGLGSSDAHHEDTLGCCYTEFPDSVRGMKDVVEAIRGRKTRASSGRQFEALRGGNFIWNAARTRRTPYEIW